MTSQEINSYLNRMYKYVDSENPDEEQQYYNNNIANIRTAIKLGLLIPEDVSEEQLNDLINNGTDDLRNEIKASYVQKNKKTSELRFNTVEEIQDYLDTTDFSQSSEETDQEVGLREGRIEYIKYALDKGILLPQNLTKELLTDYVVDEIPADLENKIEEAMYDEEEQEYVQPVPDGPIGDQTPIKEDLPNFMKASAEESILPQNASVPQSWIALIKNFLKEKSVVAMNFIKDLLER